MARKHTRSRQHRAGTRVVYRTPNCPVKMDIRTTVLHSTHHAAKPADADAIPEPMPVPVPEPVSGEWRIAVEGSFRVV